MSASTHRWPSPHSTGETPEPANLQHWPVGFCQRLAWGP